MQTIQPLHELIKAVIASTPIAESRSTVKRSTSDAAVEPSGTDTTATATVALQQNTAQIAQLQSLFSSQIGALTENTRALYESSITGDQSVLSKVASASRLAGPTFGAGTFLSPVLGGLLRLFGGSGSNPQSVSPLVHYASPASLSIEAGVRTSGADLLPVSYGQGHLPRANPATPTVTVQVNALDSRSFIDNSTEIASAVRRALLESSALSDVIGEL